MSKKKKKCLIPLSAVMYMQILKERNELYKNWLETKNEKDMTTQEELYQQYLDEVGSFERYGSKNVITFDEWKWLKSTMENTRPVCESELNTYRELLGHSTQDIDTLE